MGHPRLLRGRKNRLWLRPVHPPIRGDQNPLDSIAVESHPAHRTRKDGAPSVTTGKEKQTVAKTGPPAHPGRSESPGLDSRGIPPCAQNAQGWGTLGYYGEGKTDCG